MELDSGFWVERLAHEATRRTAQASRLLGPRNSESASARGHIVLAHFRGSQWVEAHASVVVELLHEDAPMDCVGVWFLVSPTDRERILEAIRARFGQLPERQFQEMYSGVREQRNGEAIVIVQSATTYYSSALQAQTLELREDVKQGVVPLDSVYVWSMDGDPMPQSMTWVKDGHVLDEEGVARLLQPPSSP